MLSALGGTLEFELVCLRVALEGRFKRDALGGRFRDPLGGGVLGEADAPGDPLRPTSPWVG